MRIRDENGIVIPNIKRTAGGGIAVENSAEYLRYIKDKEMREQVVTLKQEVTEIKDLLHRLIETINKT